MNLAIRNIQDTGKTALMVGHILEFLNIGSRYKAGYRPDDVIVNFLLRVDGAHCINNTEMRQYVKDMVTKQYAHKIIGITEADRVFPARFWSKPEQTDALIGLWQDVKLFNMILWDAHIGTSVDLLMRQTAQMELIPTYDKANDCIHYVVLNGMNQSVYRKTLHRVSINVFPYYDRWQAII